MDYFINIAESSSGTYNQVQLYQTFTFKNNNNTFTEIIQEQSMSDISRRQHINLSTRFKEQSSAFVLLISMN